VEEYSMKKFMIAACLSVSLCSVAAFADSMSGYISDAHCGAKHDKVSAANTKCVEDMCIKGGADPVLVSDGKVMKFDADSMAKAKPFAGQMVKIDGTMDGGMVKISSIEKAQ
jgi:hypothetical protein